MKRKRDLVAAAAGSLFCSYGFRIQQHSKGRGRNLGVLHLVEGWGKHDDSQAHTRRAHGQRVPGCPCGRGGQRVPFFLSLSVLVYTVHAPDLGSISCLIPDRSGRWFWTGAFLGFWGDGEGDIRSIVDFMFGGGGGPSGGQYCLRVYKVQ